MKMRARWDRGTWDRLNVKLKNVKRKMRKAEFPIRAFRVFRGQRSGKPVEEIGEDDRGGFAVDEAAGLFDGFALLPETGFGFV